MHQKKWNKKKSKVNGIVLGTGQYLEDQWGMNAEVKTKV